MNTEPQAILVRGSTFNSGLLTQKLRPLTKSLHPPVPQFKVRGKVGLLQGINQKVIYERLKTEPGT